MGRRANVDRGVDKCISLPGSLVEKLDLLLVDPVTGKTEYGAYSRLITQLLQKWINERSKVELQY